jgi:hypothetical protein
VQNLYITGKRQAILVNGDLGSSKSAKKLLVLQGDYEISFASVEEVNNKKWKSLEVKRDYDIE